MADTKPLREFLDTARSRGATDEQLASLLRGRGWPEEDVQRALAENFEARTGLTVPAFRHSGSAKDAFLYLLSFATLAIWSIGLGSVMFTLIDRWIADPLSPATYGRPYYEMAGALACVIVGFPIYLLVMRYIVSEVVRRPEKLESSVRKWLTYLALLIAAGIVVGDLISFLTSFLRGELTWRFVSKVITVFVLAGGIFWYYLGSLRVKPVKREPAHE